jgi:hypothetical protein
MTKLAELPGGKLLKFNDDVSEKDMRRAVRRELGLANDDLLEGFEKAAEAFREAGEEQAGRHKELMARLGEAREHSDEVVANLSKAMTGLAREQGALALSMRAAADKQAALVSKMQISMAVLDKTLAALNKTLDTALGQSLDAVDRSGESLQGIARLFAEGVNAVTKASAGLSLMMTSLQKTAAMRRSATRHRDGTWSIGPERAS